MKIYLSIGGSKKVKDFVKSHHNCGWCLAPQNYRPTEDPYFLDDGAFFAHKHKKIWDEVAFKVLVNRYPDYDFVVAPDIVMGGLQSLALSLKYVDEIPGPLYLAVQDGMDAQTVLRYIHHFKGIFIGGSLTWKFQTARMWVDIAHLNGLKCHAGRVGTWEGLIHMHFCGVDSVDSSSASRNNDLRAIKSYFNHLKFQRELIIP